VNEIRCFEDCLALDCMLLPIDCFIFYSPRGMVLEFAVWGLGLMILSAGRKRNPEPVKVAEA